VEIVIAGRDKAAIESLHGIVDSPMRKITLRHISNGHADPLHGVAIEPDVLLLLAGAAELGTLAGSPASGRPECLVIGPADDASLIRLAMKAGARDYLGNPVDRDELLANLQQIENELRQPSHSPAGRMLTVVSAKGGAGASFVAANLAHVLASRGGQRVALLDLDLQFGCLGQYLDLEPSHPLAEVVDMAPELDSVALDAYMAKNASGLGLLGPAHDESIFPGDLSADRLGTLLDLLRANYEWTVTDLTRHLDELNATALERADYILIVLQQEVATIRDAQRLQLLMTRELGIDPDRLLLVLNRFNKNSAVELEDICRTMDVGKDQLIRIPNSYRDVAESINVGIPILEQSGSSSVTKGLEKLADHFMDSTPARPGGLLSRAFSSFLGGKQHGIGN